MAKCPYCNSKISFMEYLFVLNQNTRIPSRLRILNAYECRNCGNKFRTNIVSEFIDRLLFPVIYAPIVYYMIHNNIGFNIMSISIMLLVGISISFFWWEFFIIMEPEK